MNKLLINTPQNVNLAYNFAPIGTRVLAFVIDTVIMLIYLIASLYLVLQTIPPHLDSWSIAALISLALLPSILYPLLCETFLQGQSLGKKFMKIKVVKIDGTRASFYQYFIRWVTSLVDIVFTMGGFGMASIILTKNNQRLGDLAADTTVISIKENIALQQTLYQELTAEYSIRHPEVIQLSDKDINEVKDIYDIGLQRRDYKIIQILAAKLEALLAIQSDAKPDDFIRQIIRDHYFLFRDHQ